VNTVALLLCSVWANDIHVKKLVYGIFSRRKIIPLNCQFFDVWLHILWTPGDFKNHKFLKLRELFFWFHGIKFAEFGLFKNRNAYPDEVLFVFKKQK